MVQVFLGFLMIQYNFKNEKKQKYEKSLFLIVQLVPNLTDFISEIPCNATVYWTVCIRNLYVDFLKTHLRY